MRRLLAAAGHPLWADRLDGIEVRFVGRGPGDRGGAAAAARAPNRIAWGRQIHSARVLDAVSGPCGDGDALITRQRGLALSVVTADCVPALLGGNGEIASIHAGWRGIAAGIVEETLARLSVAPRSLTAWLGPAIGPCCYEVGEEVADQVAAACGFPVVVPGGGDRPHLDLHEAVAGQLRKAGVGSVRRVPECTRCAAELLWSYRREGPGAGRNLAFVWLR